MLERQLPQQKRNILSMCNGEYTAEEIAFEYGMSLSYVHRIIRELRDNHFIQPKIGRPDKPLKVGLSRAQTYSASLELDDNAFNNIVAHFCTLATDEMLEMLLSAKHDKPIKPFDPQTEADKILAVLVKITNLRTVAFNCPNSIMDAYVERLVSEQ